VRSAYITRWRHAYVFVRLQREVVGLKKERDQLRTNVDCFVTQLADALAETDVHGDQVAVLQESLAALQAEHAQCSAALSAQREAALIDAALARTRATQLEDTNAALTTTREELLESQRNLKAAIQQRDNAALRAHHLFGSVKGASQTRAKERSVSLVEFDAPHVAHGHALATLQVDHARCSAALSAHEQSALLDAALARTRASELEKAQAALTTTTRSLSESQGALSEALQQCETAASRADNLASALQEAIQVQQKAADQRSELQEQLDALCAAHAGCAAALAVARATATSEHAKVAEARRRIQELEAAGHAGFDMTNAEVVSDQAQHLGQLFDRLANLAVRRPFAA
jgi:chromosome segregation ATPase